MQSNTEDTRDTLSGGISLRVYNDNEIVFEDRGKWLYPLFELEEFLDAGQLDPSRLFLHDKVAGRAAASLISGMGFKKCFIDTVSSGALQVFEKEGITCSYSILVDKIACMTEEIIKPDMEREQIYHLLKQRAGLVKGLELEIKGLIAGYSGKPVLVDFNLSMKPGEKLVITGDNGAGKSTLMKTLIGSLPAAGGDILLGGKDIKKMRKIPSPVGYVNQSIGVSHSPLTAFEIVSAGMIGIKIPSAEKRHRVEIAMRRTGCLHLGGSNFYALSGGERQRISLARCLCQEAGLILMDEPTSFLDQDAKKELVFFLNNSLSRQLLTVLLVSHDHEWIERLSWPVRKLKEGKLC
ncbi:MAG: DUF1893 domain-containing protein [Spirochaetia bacterium]|nr:DUF1893 domain-containing protein [Spirochaetia bacterium]